MHSLKALWEAQLREWPESEKISVQEMYRWADAAPTIERKLSRWMMIGMALQFPRFIFYRTHPADGKPWVGCRYGPKGHQYLCFTDV
jgi:hypothetical protein